MICPRVSGQVIHQRCDLGIPVSLNGLTHSFHARRIQCVKHPVDRDGVINYANTYELSGLLDPRGANPPGYLHA